MSETHSALGGLGHDRNINSSYGRLVGVDIYPWSADLFGSAKKILVLSGFTWTFSSVQNETRFLWKIAISRGSVWACTCLTMDRTVYIPSHMQYDKGRRWSSCPLPVTAQDNQGNLHARWPAWTDVSNSPTQASQGIETTIQTETISWEMAKTPSSTKTGKSTAKIMRNGIYNAAASYWGTCCSGSHSGQQFSLNVEAPAFEPRSVFEADTCASPSETGQTNPISAKDRHEHQNIDHNGINAENDGYCNMTLPFVNCTTEELKDFLYDQITVEHMKSKLAAAQSKVREYQCDVYDCFDLISTKSFAVHLYEKLPEVIESLISFHEASYWWWKYNLQKWNFTVEKWIEFETAGILWSTKQDLWTFNIHSRHVTVSGPVAAWQQIFTNFNAARI